jgi:hypothetical protein
MHHKHPGDISLNPRSPELVLLPLRQPVVDRVLQLVMICAVVGGDCLPCSVSYCISISFSENWTLVLANHTRLIEDLHDCLVLFSSRAHNSLDSELWQSGDVDAVQQIPQSVGWDWSFISGALDLIDLTVHLVLLGVTQGSVVLIIFIFSIVASFFFGLVVFFFFLMIIVMVVIVAIVL